MGRQSANGSKINLDVISARVFLRTIYLLYYWQTERNEPPCRACNVCLRICACMRAGLRLPMCLQKKASQSVFTTKGRSVRFSDVMPLHDAQLATKTFIYRVDVSDVMVLDAMYPSTSLLRVYTTSRLSMARLLAPKWLPTPLTHCMSALCVLRTGTFLTQCLKGALITYGYDVPMSVTFAYCRFTRQFMLRCAEGMCKRKAPLAQRLSARLCASMAPVITTRCSSGTCTNHMPVDDIKTANGVNPVYVHSASCISHICSMGVWNFMFPHETYAAHVYTTCPVFFGYSVANALYDIT